MGGSSCWSPSCFSRKCSKETRINVKPGHKIVVIGSSGVGKSALIWSFAFDKFLAEHEPTRIRVHGNPITIDGEEEDVDIVEASDQEDRASATDACFRNADGFLCVFSVTDFDSLFATEALRELAQRATGDNSIPIVLVGNKTDVTDKRQVTFPEAKVMANDWGVPYIVASAKTKRNVDKAFYELVRQIIIRKNATNKGGLRKHLCQREPKEALKSSEGISKGTLTKRQFGKQQTLKGD